MTDEQNDQGMELKFNLANLDAYISLSEKSASEGRNAESINMMREGVDRFPDEAKGQYAMAMALMSGLKADLARDVLWESLSDEESLAERAQDALQAAIGLDPNMWQAYRSLGTLLAVRGRIRKALEVWRESLVLNPDQPDLEQDIKMYAERENSDSTDDEVPPRQ
ncbi:hypothetical protein CVU37_02820 [candidate division BRC1 bacterium HGW-BRC1-1]|jgi:tetratricopeptide (TPR) repeat protein|nr:MAG: hypothetical protein CVU37_02820 [candidate division BRC1 bacterium HGW-BRC1-1]